jgi:tRNA1Val (adenine37-N6)-methyltransferase
LLGKTVSVMQPKSGFRVGTDAVLLAAAIGVNRGRILDMGAGVGGSACVWRGGLMRCRSPRLRLIR